MKLTLSCPCGELVIADGEDEMVQKAQQHLAEVHPGREYSRDEILFLAF